MRYWLIAASCLAVVPLAPVGCQSPGPSGPIAPSQPVAKAPPITPILMEEVGTRMSTAIGADAPGFTLANQDDQKVRLSDFVGKWVVLYFYPSDDTPGCTCEATEFTSLLNQFNALDAVVLGVSPDPPQSHRAFREKYGLQIMLLSDGDLAVLRKYGAWVDLPGWRPPQGRVVRGTYLIGSDGKIAWHWPDVYPAGHADRVARKIVELKQMEGH